MNCYEHTFITKSDLSESQSKKIVEKYENIIKKNNGKIIKLENWGLRILSFKITAETGVNLAGIRFHGKLSLTIL